MAAEAAVVALHTLTMLQVVAQVVPELLAWF
jgi:hypothetical protein